MRARLPTLALWRLQALVLVALSLMATDVSAMTVVAGMCDPVGASVPAPLPVMPARGGAIDVLEDCEQLFAGFGKESPTRDSASLQTADDGPQPAPLASFLLLPRQGRRLPVPRATLGRAMPGYASGVFRPPRAA